MFRRLQRAILFLVGFSIPIQAESIAIGPMRATMFKIVTVLLMVLAGLQIAQRSGERVRDPKAVWLVAFGLSVVIALAMSIAAGLPAGPPLQLTGTMIGLLAYYFLLGFTVRRREDLNLLLWSLVLGGATTAAPAVLGLQSASVETTYGGRFEGLSGQENRFGSDMGVCLAAALALFFPARSRFAKAVLAGCALFALIGVGLSLSRAAFVALAAMWAFWMYRSGRVGALRWALPAMLLAVGVMLVLPESVEQRVQTMTDPSARARDDSIQGRFVMGAWALRAFASNPVLGVGAGRFAHWVHEHPGTDGLAWHSIHNAYLSIAAEHGLFGLAPFLAIIALSWFDYSRCWRATRARRALRDPLLLEYASYALFLQTAMLGPVVAGLAHQSHHSKPLWTMMALSPVLVALVRRRTLELGAELGHEEPTGFLNSPATLPVGRAPAR